MAVEQASRGETGSKFFVPPFLLLFFVVAGFGVCACIRSYLFSWPQCLASFCAARAEVVALLLPIAIGFIC